MMQINSTLGFTYTLDQKDGDTWSILEQGIRFDSIGEAFIWINLHEDALEAYHNETNQGE